MNVLWLLADVAPPVAQAPIQMGRIQGGWEYVWACYAITWAGIALFALSLWLRRPAPEPRSTPEHRSSPEQGKKP